jgi:DNA-binding GntR family transcriptional regulator
MAVRYKQVYEILRRRIQQEEYTLGASLPSENELCREFSITRTTVRSALDELDREGFIERSRGRRSVVRERRQSLGLLNVKGFSEAAGDQVSTRFLAGPEVTSWPLEFPFPFDPQEAEGDAVSFSRLRSIKGIPVMWEQNWFSARFLPEFVDSTLVDGSFFRTLSRKYMMEITGSEHELRAELADKRTSGILELEEGSPVLKIHIRFSTSKNRFFIYSILYCNTGTYPIANKYSL